MDTGKGETNPRSVSHPDGLFYLQDFCSPESASTFLSALYKAGAAKPTPAMSFRPVDQQTLKWVQVRHRRLMNIGGCPPTAASQSSIVLDTTTGGTETGKSGRRPKKVEALPSWVVALAFPQLEAINLPFVPSFRALDHPQHSLSCSIPLTTTAPTGGVPIFKKVRLVPPLHSESRECKVGEELRGVNGLPNHVLVNEYRYPEGCIFPHEDGPSYEPLVAIVSLQSDVPLVFRPKRSRRDDTKKRCLESTGDDENTGMVALLLEANSLVVFTNSFYHDYLHEVPAPGWNRRRESSSSSRQEGGGRLQEEGGYKDIDLESDEQVRLVPLADTGIEEVEAEGADDYLDPKTFINYDIVRARMQRDNGEDAAAQGVNHLREDGDGRIPLHRGNVRTSVTYRVVPAFQQQE